MNFFSVYVYLDECYNNLLMKMETTIPRCANHSRTIELEHRYSIRKQLFLKPNVLDVTHRPGHPSPDL